LHTLPWWCPPLLLVLLLLLQQHGCRRCRTTLGCLHAALLDERLLVPITLLRRAIALL
jgi:hypothetical protein